MGLFDFVNSKEKQINNLIEAMKSEHERYEKDAKELNKIIDLKVRDYNDQIPIINTIRNNEFGPQIDKLYKFLKNIGDVGVEISPFDFVTEKSRVNHHNDMSQSEYNQDNKDSAYTDFGSKVGAGMAAGASTFASASTFAGVSTIGFVAVPLTVVAPLIIAPFAIGGIINGIMKSNDNKEKVLELNRQLESDKLKYKNDIMARERYCDTMEDATKIAEIYRVNIKSISRSIDETILPELSLVKSFLLAEDAKNKIIANEEITELRPESILMYKDTPYNKHYIFVNNTFHFYKMIVEFFSKPILTTLLEDHQITQQEKDDFNSQIESIKTQLKQVYENSIMNEVV